MSFEAITTISEAEETAKRVKAQAAQDAKAAIAAAEAEGKAGLDAAEKKAAEEIRALRARSDEKAKADAQELANVTEEQKAAMLEKAQGRMDKAAALIVERVVNG